MKTLQAITISKPSKLTADEKTNLVNSMADNLLSIFDESTPAELADGIAWYAVARGIAATMARTYGLTIGTCAYVIAALSPNNSWARNVIDAYTVLNAVRDNVSPDDIKTSTYGANKLKSYAIASTSDTLILSGNKTRAFADNIARAQSKSVTIDFHAYSAATGTRFTTQTAKGLSDAVYQLTVDAYNVAADRIGIKGYELQAVVWVTWRRLQGLGAHLG